MKQFKTSYHRRWRHWLLLFFSGIGILVFFQNCNHKMQAGLNSATSETSLEQMPSVHPSDLPVLPGTSTGNPGKGLVSYQMIYEKIFEPSCVSCHSEAGRVSEINYDSYQNTMQSGDLESLKESYEDNKEPNRKCNSISKLEKELVLQWLEAGAPEY